jgi:hypothetical protein
VRKCLLFCFVGGVCCGNGVRVETTTELLLKIWCCADFLTIGVQKKKRRRTPQFGGAWEFL